MPSTLLALSLLLGLSGCSGLFKGGKDGPSDHDPSQGDGGGDSGAVNDGGLSDGGGDAGASDGGTTDGGAGDGGAGDGGATDPLTTDDDHDGFSEADGDCNDADGGVSPGATETPYDRVDNDCDPSTPDDDLDGDGHGSTALGGDDCNDADPTAYPGATEDTGDSVDNDCDGAVDERFDVETVVDGCDCGNPSSVAVDSSDQVHVVWFNADDGSLQYALRDPSGWGAVETVVDVPWAVAGEYLDSVVDAADRLQVAYTFWAEGRSGNTEVDFSFRDPDGTWSDPYVVEDASVNGSTDLGAFVSIDVDDANLPSFAYYDYTNRQPRLADVLTSPWTLFGIDALYAHLDENYLYQLGLEDCDIGFWTSLQIDESGYDNVAYYDDCALAQEAQFTRLDWTFDALAWSETIASQGWYSSLGRDGSGALCVAWYDASSADLDFGCSTDGGFTWSSETVDSAGAVGEGAALAFDSKGDPWIAYYDATHGNLKVAHERSGSWETITVDEAGDVGLAPSIAIDGGDTVHMTWYDNSKGVLKYGWGR